MIFKIAILAIIFAVIIIYLKSINPEMAILATVCSVGLLLTLTIDMLDDVFSLFYRLSEICNIGEGTLKIVVKATLIAYIVEFSASVVEDFGIKSLADKLIFVGKIVIVCLCAPILEALIKIIEGLL